VYQLTPCWQHVGIMESEEISTKSLQTLNKCSVYAGEKDGGAEGIRTPDPHNAIVVLYQLSYDPIAERRQSKEPARFVKAVFPRRLFRDSLRRGNRRSSVASRVVPHVGASMNAAAMGA
jgi:hypothetical protein